MNAVVNIESVTIIVTVFMLGLGLGSLAGGKLSTQPGVRLLLAFGTIELSMNGEFIKWKNEVFHPGDYTRRQSRRPEHIASGVW
jgi:hypothetical protein